VSNPVAPSALGATSIKVAAVPFSGVVTGGMYVAMGTGNVQNCPSGRTNISNGTGTALHMGNVTYYTEQCVNTLTGEILGNKLVLTAANGDELYGTFVGQSAPAGNVGDVFSVSATFVFAGGTGRFQDATGTATMTAELTHAAAFPWPARWTWSGTIRY
jgi:hypothetical protein